MADLPVKGGGIHPENVGGKTVWTGEGSPSGETPTPSAAENVPAQPSAIPLYNYASISMPHDSTTAPPQFGQAQDIQIVTNHVRATSGHNIDIAATAGTKGGLQSVRATLNGQQILNEYFAEPRQTYRKHFNQIGSGSPGMEHKLEVAATDVTGNEQQITDVWEDLV